MSRWLLFFLGTTTRAVASIALSPHMEALGWVFAAWVAGFGTSTEFWAWHRRNT